MHMKTDKYIIIKPSINAKILHLIKNIIII